MSAQSLGGDGKIGLVRPWGGRGSVCLFGWGIITGSPSIPRGPAYSPPIRKEKLPVYIADVKCTSILKKSKCRKVGVFVWMRPSSHSNHSRDVLSPPIAWVLELPLHKSSPVQGLYHPHFTGEQVEVQRLRVAHPWSCCRSVHSWA